MESQPVPNIDHLLTNIGRTAASQGEVSGNTLASGGSNAFPCSAPSSWLCCFHTAAAFSFTSNC